MEKIRRIYFSMSKGEKRYLRNFLSAFHVKGENTSLKLISLLERYPEIEQEEVATRLYGNPRSKAFLMMKSRLLERMMEVMALSINLENNPGIREDQAGYVAIDIQKQLVYSVLLRRRGLYDLSGEVYQKCLKQARASGFPEHQLQALIGLRNLAATKSVAEVAEYGRQIKEALQIFETDLAASQVFDSFQAHLQESAGSGDAALQFLDEHLPAVEEAIEEHYSPRAHYYHLSLLITQYQTDRKYSKAREALQELVDLLEAHRGIASKNRLGTTYLRLAALELQDCHFEEGYQSASQAMNTFPVQKTNFMYASTYLIFACLYRLQVQEARKAINGLEYFRKRGRGGTYLDLLVYLDSCTEYLAGDYRHAYDLLGDVQTLFADKSGWNISLRIYEIMLLIDRDLPDLASPKIEALRKHIAKYQGGDRLESMFRFLVLLERKSFDFSSPGTEMTDILARLTTEYQWDAVSPEVVRFDTWIRRHQSGRPFPEVFAREMGRISTASLMEELPATKKAESFPKE